jgi:methionyl aminopeptidase
LPTLPEILTYDLTMSIKSDEDLAGMTRVGRVVALTISRMRAAIRVGMTTAELDEVALGCLLKYGARSAPLFTYGFPGQTCISVNEEIVHGVPGPRRLLAGDVVKIDVTAELGGYIADAATTVLLPPIAPVASRLKRSAEEALRGALGVAQTGRRVSVIGRAVESQARRDGFSVVRELCGHGVGRRIHEDPQVPNYENRLSRDRLTEGLVVAIEPMLTARPSSAVQMDDGWTIRTSTRDLAVHEEHTVMIRAGAPLVFTAA